MKNEIKKENKSKEFVIQVKSLKDSLKHFAVAYDKLLKGQKFKPIEKFTFANVDTFRKFLTTKRLELLRIIRNKKINSINELSRITGRDYKSINTDLDVLERINLVSMEKEDHKVRPKVEFDEINVKISLEA